ncbi:MAG: MBL fold metallo-hydrolase [Deltaproteobacteria bacterium]|nr:MAG: MBL fold metallo-hydrolase [Deltaproteobacteria bacterium]
MKTLFHHDLTVVPLGSGSRGNATYMTDGVTGVLIDCGLSTRQIARRLQAVGLGDAPLDAVLITHEHSDHCASAAILERHLLKKSGAEEPQVPFYMSVGTAQGLPSRCRPQRIRPIVPGSPLSVGGLRIEPISVPHDTLDPVSFTVASGASRAGVLTDFGTSTRLITQQLASLDVAVIEFNHDVQMLLEGPHPWQVKQRVRGNHGHLSNAQAADLLAEAARMSRRLRHVVLAHLSQHNNTPDLARRACDEALHRAGRRGVKVHVAPQEEPLTPIVLSRSQPYDLPRRVDEPAQESTEGAEIIPFRPRSAG